MAMATPNRPKYSVERVLASCARVGVDAFSFGRAATYLRGIDDWNRLVLAAEAHGLAPLLHAHVDASSIALPSDARRVLRGLYLRYRQSAHVRMRVLERILEAFEEAGVDTLVLKGGALAYLIYLEPALRPMGDVDFLVKSDQLPVAQTTLARAGFASISQSDGRFPDKHVVAVGSSEGLTIKVELHHSLFSRPSSDSPSPGGLFRSRRVFRVGDRTAFTLGNEAMLWHLCRHVVFHADVFTRLRLIWVADVVGFAEHVAKEIDWESIRIDRPIVLDVLSLLDLVTPLSDNLRRLAGLPSQTRPRGTWGDFAGWPRQSIGDSRRAGKSLTEIVYDTFLPPDWWLRLHHGLGTTQPLWLHRWVKHPLEMTYWIGHYVQQRARMRLFGG